MAMVARNQLAGTRNRALGKTLDSGQVTGSAKPDIQALRDICAGKIEAAPSAANFAEPPERPPANFATAHTQVFFDSPIVEGNVSTWTRHICGKTWWEECEHYECLMDAGHREGLVGKHGLRGMVRKLDT